jgi:hypothetical protein
VAYGVASKGYGGKQPTKPQAARNEIKCMFCNEFERWFLTCPAEHPNQATVLLDKLVAVHLRELSQRIADSDPNVSRSLVPGRAKRL